LAEPKPDRVVQSFVADELLRGFGLPTTKSAALSLVSKQPSFFLMAAMVFESCGARPPPSKQFVAVP
jgi:hypothetical protein